MTETDIIRYSVRDDALLLSEEQRGAALEAKAASGARLDDEELQEILVRNMVSASDRIMAAMKDARSKPGKEHAVLYSQGQHDAINKAIDLVLTELAIHRFHAVRNRERLEDRVAAIEAAVKPRHRVPAPSRAMA